MAWVIFDMMYEAVVARVTFDMRAAAEEDDLEEVMAACLLTTFFDYPSGLPTHAVACAVVRAWYEDERCGFNSEFIVLGGSE